MGQKILVVEDNELNLKLFCDLLRAHGYEAEPVRDGREAVARARSFGPDLIIMDIQMPYITGLELIEQMKADDGLKRTPIMAVTAYAAKGDEQRIRDAGAEGYVSKPISLMRFIEAVRGLLAAVPEVEPEEPRQSRESGNPSDASTETPPEEETVDSRFRGNDGEGGGEPVRQGEAGVASEADKGVDAGRGSPEGGAMDTPTRHFRESGNPSGASPEAPREAEEEGGFPLPRE